MSLKRYTRRDDQLDFEDDDLNKPIYTKDYVVEDHSGCEYEHKLGQLEDKEEKLGIDLNEFLEELNFVLLNSSETMGYTRKRKPIPADYGYVMDFLKRLKEAMEEEE